MKRAGLIVLLTALCSAHCSATAADSSATTLVLDSARSHAAFEVRVLFLVGLHGEFGAVRGTLHVADGKVHVDAEIATNDLHMRSTRYENWTKSAEFFDVEKFPTVHFASEGFPLTYLQDGGSIAGTLTLRGIAKRVTLTIARPDCADALAGKCALEAEGTIRRSEFGMRSRRATLSDKVDLRLSIQLQPPARSP